MILTREERPEEKGVGGWLRISNFELESRVIDIFPTCNVHWSWGCCGVGALPSYHYVRYLV